MCRKGVIKLKPADNNRSKAKIPTAGGARTKRAPTFAHVAEQKKEAAYRAEEAAAKAKRAAKKATKRAVDHANQKRQATRKRKGEQTGKNQRLSRRKNQPRVDLSEEDSVDESGLDSDADMADDSAASEDVEDSEEDLGTDVATSEEEEEDAVFMEDVAADAAGEGIGGQNDEEDLEGEGGERYYWRTLGYVADSYGSESEFSDDEQVKLTHVSESYGSGSDL